jgi:hypothetical protein
MADDPKTCTDSGDAEPTKVKVSNVQFGICCLLAAAKHRPYAAEQLLFSIVVVAMC